MDTPEDAFSEEDDSGLEAPEDAVTDALDEPREPELPRLLPGALVLESVAEPDVCAPLDDPPWELPSVDDDIPPDVVALPEEELPDAPAGPHAPPPHVSPPGQSASVVHGSPQPLSVHDAVMTAPMMRLRTRTIVSSPSCLVSAVSRR